VKAGMSACPVRLCCLAGDATHGLVGIGVRWEVLDQDAAAIGANRDTGLQPEFRRAARRERFEVAGDGAPVQETARPDDVDQVLASSSAVVIRSPDRASLRGRDRNRDESGR
jgi:hypothetical protein